MQGGNSVRTNSFNYDNVMNDNAKVTYAQKSKALANIVYHM